MNFDRIGEFSTTFDNVRAFLVRERETLTRISTIKQLTEGESSVLAADLQAEQMLVPAAHALWPDLPILCEEAENSGLATRVPNAIILPYDDRTENLPVSYISIDGLDGSVMYANGRLQDTAISIGVIQNGAPSDGWIGLLSDSEKAYYTDNFTVYSGPSTHKLTPATTPLPLKQCLHGTDDNKSVDNRFRELVISRLNSNRGTRYPVNLPSVAGALGVLKGELAFYITSNARNWDIAGTAALCQERGQIVRCLDGSAIPWNKVRMPPVVFARDEEAFNYAHDIASDYLK